MSYFQEVSFRDTFQMDAFGRLRSSEPGNRWDNEYIYDKQPLQVDEVTDGSGATATHDANSRDITLAIVNTTTGTGKGLYSHYDIPYTTGNSQLVDVTGTLDLAAIGGGTAYLFIRTKVSGSVVETATAQSSWAVGGALTTALHTSIDWRYSQILAMDLQSLKVGRVRFGFVRNGVAVAVHEIYNDNIRNTGYWQRPTLPQYHRIYNDANYTYTEMGFGDTENGIGIYYRIAKNASATMKAICSTVKSEGGLDILALNGYPFGISNRTTGISVAATLIPVISIRMAATFNGITNRGLALVKSFSLTIDNPVNYRILYRPTLTGASWASVDTNSFMEYDVSASAVTGGTLIEDDCTSTSRNVPASKTNSLGRMILSQGRTGTSDILTLAAIRTSANSSNTFGAWKWEEIR